MSTPSNNRRIGMLAGWGRYPIVIAGATFVIGLLFLPETKDRDIYAGDSSIHAGDKIVSIDPMAVD